MTKLTIKTDNKWKDFKYAWDVPKRILRNQFDWMDNPTDHTFVKYLGHWYALADFGVIGPGAPREFSRWDGTAADGFCSGVLIRISPDVEQYKIATYMS